MVVHNDAFYPKPITINLNNNLFIDVMCFDFPTQLLHLLQNQKITQSSVEIWVNETHPRAGSRASSLEALSSISAILDTVAPSITGKPWDTQH